MRFVLVDTNLLLLIVGRVSPRHISTHKRTRGFDRVDFEVISAFVDAYDSLVTIPHVPTETSNLIGQIKEPLRSELRSGMVDLVQTCEERIRPSLFACRHHAFATHGMTDAAILSLCEETAAGDVIDLLTADEPLYNRALSLGLPAELYA